LAALLTGLAVATAFSAAALLATLVCLVHLFAPFICSFAHRINKTLRHS
jgi:hypothetical protein